MYNKAYVKDQTETSPAPSDNLTITETWVKEIMGLDSSGWGFTSFGTNKHQAVNSNDKWVPEHTNDGPTSMKMAYQGMFGGLPKHLLDTSWKGLDNWNKFTCVPAKQEGDDENDNILSYSTTVGLQSKPMVANSQYQYYSTANAMAALRCHESMTFTSDFWALCLRCFPFKADNGDEWDCTSGAAQAYWGHKETMNYAWRRAIGADVGDDSAPYDYNIRGNRVTKVSWATSTHGVYGKDGYDQDSAKKYAHYDSITAMPKNADIDDMWQSTFFKVTPEYKQSPMYGQPDGTTKLVHDEKHQLPWTPLSIDHPAKAALCEAQRYIIHPFYVNGAWGQKGFMMGRSIRVGFAYYMTQLLESIGYWKAGTFESVKDEFERATTPEERALFYILRPTADITNIDPRTTMNAWATAKNSQSESSKNYAMPEATVAVVNALFQVQDDEKINNLTAFCKLEFDKSVKVYEVPNFTSNKSVKELFKDAYGVEDISLEQFAKWCTFDDDKLLGHGQDAVSGQSGISMESWMKYCWANDRRKVYNTWGAMQAPKTEARLRPYHLWGSYCHRWKKFIRPSDSTTQNLDPGNGGYDNEEKKRNDTNVGQHTGQGRLDYWWGEKFNSQRGRSHIYRAFGKFRKGDAGGQRTRNKKSESGKINNKYAEAIENIGIPWMNPDDTGTGKGVYPKLALKEIAAAYGKTDEKSYKYPTDKEKNILEKGIQKLFSDPHTNFIRCTQYTDTLSTKLGSDRVSTVKKFALSTNEYLFQSEEAFTHIAIANQGMNSMLNFDADLSSIGSALEWSKKEAKKVADGQENETVKNALLKAINDNSEDVPEFKGVYYPFATLKLIINEFYDALKFRLQQDPSEFGQIGSGPSTAYPRNPLYMVATYVRQCAWCCMQWYNWIKANNAIVWKWYSLKFLLEEQPNIDPKDLATIAKDAGAEIESKANDDLQDAQEEDKKAEEELEKRKGKLAKNRKKGLKRDQKARKAKEEMRERERLAEQCVLMGNIQKLKTKQQELIQKEIGKRNHEADIHREGVYGNRFHMLNETQQQHSKIPTYLSSPKKSDINIFTQITPDLVSALSPKIRLFKVFSDAYGAGVNELEFPFENFNTVGVDGKSYMASPLDKGHGVGIKSFSFSFDGTTPATARKDIKAELTLYFQNFQDLIKKRKFGKDYPEFRYIELLLLPFSTPDARHPNDYRPEFYRIRADVGWNERVDPAFKQILAKRCAKDPLFKNIKEPLKSFNNALGKINKSFYLNMIDHDLDIKNDGTVEIKITYAAYVESAMKSSSLDALSTPESIFYRRSNQKEFEDILAKGDCSPQQLNTIKRRHQRKEDIFIKTQFQSLKRRLILRRKVFYVGINSSEVSNFVKNGVMPKLKDKNIKIGPNILSDKEYKLDSLKNLDTETKINFFFLGDLLHTILDCMYEMQNPPDPKKDFDPYKRGINVSNKLRAEVRNTRLLLSSFVYDDYYKDDEKTKIFNDVNIAEIPISMQFFQDWMNENVIKPERKKYPVMDFIRDLSQTVVNAFLETCINKSIDKSITFQTGQILALGTGKKYEDKLIKIRDKSQNDTKLKSLPKYMINTDLRYDEGDLPLDTSSINASIHDYWNYMFIYPITAMNTSFHQGTGKKGDDEDAGIYHYQIGSNRGLLKNIKFSKTDMQYIREARFFNHGNDGLMQLSAVYKATLTMIGNTMYYPGMELFIDPRGLGGPEFDPTDGQIRSETRGVLKPASIANALGIGGYHIVTKVKSVITPEKFETVIDAQFHYSGDGKQTLLASHGKLTDEERNKIEKNMNIEKKSQEQTSRCSKIITKDIKGNKK